MLDGYVNRLPAGLSSLTSLHRSCRELNGNGPNWPKIKQFEHFSVDKNIIGEIKPLNGYACQWSIVSTKRCFRTSPFCRFLAILIQQNTSSFLASPLCYLPLAASCYHFQERIHARCIRGLKPLLPLDI